MPDNEPNPYRDYIKANEGRLARVANSVERLFETVSPEWQITILGEQQAEPVVEKGLDLEYYLDLSNGDINLAEEALGVEHGFEKAMAETAAKKALAIARINFVGELCEDEDELRRKFDETSHFDKAKSVSARFSNSEQDLIHVRRTTVKGATHIGEVDASSIKFIEDGLEQTVEIIRSGNKVIAANYVVRPITNELFEKWYKVLHADEWAEITNGLTLGVMDGDKTIEEVLENLRAKYFGSSREEEMQFLIEEVKHYAAAAKAGREISSQVNGNLPPIDHLNKLISMLED